MGRPSSALTPPCVLRIKNSGSRRRSGSQPMPAFSLHARASPETPTATRTRYLCAQTGSPDYSSVRSDERFCLLLPSEGGACPLERLSCDIQFLRAVDGKRTMDFFT